VSQAGVEYIGILSAVGGVPPYAWSIRSGSLPEGLALDAERGEIVGAAAFSTEGQGYPFEVEVSDARTRSARAPLELRVLPRRRADEAKAQPLVLLTHGALPDAQIDKPYAVYLSARGGSGAYRWSAEGLPEGFTVEQTSGLLKGASPAGGTYELVLRVRDAREGSGDAGTAVATAHLQVQGAPARQAAAAGAEGPRIITDSLPAAIQSQPYIVTLAGTGAEPLRWSARGLPPGLSITESGVIKGIPGKAGEADVTVSLTDGRDVKAPDRPLKLTVEPPPVSTLDRIKSRGIGAWLGYIILVLAVIAFRFVQGRRMARDIAILLKLHNVEFIQKPDGSTALSGPPEATEEVQRILRQKLLAQKRNKTVSSIVLAAAVLLYTFYLLR
jgi:hypothetical protein